MEHKNFLNWTECGPSLLYTDTVHVSSSPADRVSATTIENERGEIICSPIQESECVSVFVTHHLHILLFVYRISLIGERMQYVNERIKQLEKIIIANKYSAFVCDLIFYCFYIVSLEHRKFLPAALLSLRVIFQEYVHQLLSCKEVIRAQWKTCNTWTYVGKFILHPGNNLFSCMLLWIRCCMSLSQKRKHRGLYKLFGWAHMLLLLFPLFVILLASIPFLFKYPCCPESDHKPFEDKIIFHPAFVQHLAQQECLIVTVAISPTVHTGQTVTHTQEQLLPDFPSVQYSPLQKKSQKKLTCSCTLQFFTSSQWPTHGSLLKIWSCSSMKKQFSGVLELTVKTLLQTAFLAQLTGKQNFKFEDPPVDFKKKKVDFTFLF